MFNLKAAKANMYDDINKATKKQLKDIHNLLMALLKKYDNDGKWKNTKDFFALALTAKQRERCKLRFDDLIEEWDKLSFERKTEFEKDIKELVNKRQTLIELLGNLFGGL